MKPKNPYVTPCIVQAIKAKRAALRRLKKHPTAANKDSFKLARNRVTHLLRKSERAYATPFHRSLRLSPSASTSSDFWHHMKVLQGKVKTSIIPDLFSPDSSLVTTATGKADLLNTFLPRRQFFRVQTRQSRMKRLCLSMTAHSLPSQQLLWKFSMFCGHSMNIRLQASMAFPSAS